MGKCHGEEYVVVDMVEDEAQVKGNNKEIDPNQGSKKESKTESLGVVHVSQKQIEHATHLHCM